MLSSVYTDQWRVQQQLRNRSATYGQDQLQGTLGKWMEQQAQVLGGTFSSARRRMRMRKAMHKLQQAHACKGVPWHPSMPWSADEGVPAEACRTRQPNRLQYIRADKKRCPQRMYATHGQVWRSRSACQSLKRYGCSKRSAHTMRSSLPGCHKRLVKLEASYSPHGLAHSTKWTRRCAGCKCKNCSA